MDEALLSAPAGPRPPAPGRTVAPGRHVRRCPRRSLVAASLALWLGWSLRLSATEAYLPVVGPTLLRFAPPPAAHLVWPAPAVVTNAAPAPESGAASGSGTNNLPLGPTLAEFLGQTNRPPGTGPDIELSAESPPPGTAALVGSPLSASELLIVTPQMLAEYLKGPSGGTNLPPMPPLPGGELYFQPPVTPPPPGSKAIYRVQ